MVRIPLLLALSALACRAPTSETDATGSGGEDSAPDTQEETSVETSGDSDEDTGQDTNEESDTETGTETGTGGIALLDVNVRIHVEEYLPDHLTEHGTPRTDWVGDIEGYVERLEAFLAWEGELRARGVHVDFMGDSSFWVATLKNTDTWVLHDGIPLPQWLAARGHGVYCHTHHNYADAVVTLESVLGAPAPLVVGGFEIKNVDAFRTPITNTTGKTSVQFEILTGGGSDPGHDGEDDRSFGIWHPASAAAFTTDDPYSTLPYVGSGSESWEDARVLAALAGGGRLEQWTSLALMFDYEDLYGHEADPVLSGTSTSGEDTEGDSGEDSGEEPEEEGEPHDVEHATVLLDELLADGGDRVRFVNVEETVAYWRAYEGGVSTWQVVPE